VTTFFVAHDFTEILPLADRVAVVLEGRVIQTAPPLELFRNPLNESVAALVRAATDLTSGLTRGDPSLGGPP
jgi:ABC-type proline/glycine betaine transport system ATPase subunit